MIKKILKLFITDIDLYLIRKYKARQGFFARKISVEKKMINDLIKEKDKVFLKLDVYDKFCPDEPLYFFSFNKEQKEKLIKFLQVIFN